MRTLAPARLILSIKASAVLHDVTMSSTNTTVFPARRLSSICTNPSAAPLRLCRQHSHICRIWLLSRVMTMVCFVTPVVGTLATGRYAHKDSPGHLHRRQSVSYLPCCPPNGIVPAILEVKNPPVRFHILKRCPFQVSLGNVVVECKLNHIAGFKRKESTLKMPSYVIICLFPYSYSSCCQ